MKRAVAGASGRGGTHARGSLLINILGLSKSSFSMASGVVGTEAGTGSGTEASRE